MTDFPTPNPRSEGKVQDGQLSPTAFPLISVIIPTYNRPELLLDRALSSALGQQYPNLEVLVVMDGPDPRPQTAAAGAATECRALGCQELRRPGRQRRMGGLPRRR